MDIGSVSRSSPADGQSVAGRTLLSSSPGAAGVKTELPAAQAVAQAGAVPPDAVQVDLNNNAREAAARLAALDSFIQKRNAYDVKSREVVFQTVDTRTHEVVWQYPDDIALKLRAFVREINDRLSTPPSAQISTQA